MAPLATLLRTKNRDLPPVDSYRLALWGSMSPWRPPVIRFLDQLDYDTIKVFDPTLAAWNDEAYRREQAIKLLVPFFVHVVAGGRDDPRHTGLQSFGEIDELVRGPGEGIFVFDATGLNRHDIAVLRHKKDELVAQGDAVVDTMGESLPWLVQRLGLHAAFERLALKQFGEVIDQARSHPQVRSLADFAAIAEATDRPKIDTWVKIIDGNLRHFVERGGQLPLTEEIRLRLYSTIDVSHADSHPTGRVIERLGEMYAGQLTVAYAPLSPSDRDYYYGHGNGILNVVIRPL